MKKAIVFYSMSGNTSYVADFIARRIDVDLIRIEPLKEYPNKGMLKFIWGGKSAIMGETPKLYDYSFDKDKYDYIIFGTPVWASRVAPPIRTFIKENKEALKNKKIAAYVCFSGSGAEKTLEKLKEYLEIEKLDETLTLIDPKDIHSDEKDEQIEEFCERINSK